jgi:hypothetical protein
MAAVALAVAPKLNPYLVIVRMVGAMARHDPAEPVPVGTDLVSDR